MLHLFHKYKVVNVKIVKEIWCKKYSGTPLQGTDYERRKLYIELKCDKCGKTKFITGYWNEISESMKCEIQLLNGDKQS